MKYLVFMLLLCVSVSAHVFYYADEIDRADAVQFAALNPFDSIDDEDFEFCDYNCVSLDSYNHFADRNPYDSYDRITADSSKSVLKKLRRDGLNRLADENPYDSLERDDFGFSDMGCWALSDYNDFASTDRDDHWKPATLRDPDHFDSIIREVGTKRFHFFDYKDLLDVR